MLEATTAITQTRRYRYKTDSPPSFWRAPPRRPREQRAPAWVVDAESRAPRAAAETGTKEGKVGLKEVEGDEEREERAEA